MLLALALLSPTVLGQTAVQDDFSSSGSTHFAGQLDLRWDVAVVSLPAVGEREVHLNVTGAEVSLVNVPVQRIDVVVPGVDRSRFTRSEPEEVGRLGTYNGIVHVSLDPRDGDARLVCPGTFWPLRLEGGEAVVEPAGTLINNDASSRYRTARTVHGIQATPAAPHNVATVDGPALQDVGGCDLVVTGGTVLLPGEDRPRPLPYELNETRSRYDATTGTGSYVYDNWFLVLRVAAGTLEAPGPWTLAARSVEGSVEGLVALHGPTGPVWLNETRHDPSVLQMEGTFAVSGALSGEQTHWRITGDAEGFYVDMEPVWVREHAAVVTVGAVGALAALLLGLRGLGTFLLGRAMPAGLRVQPLRSKNRRRVLEAVHRRQPVRLPDLQDATGLSRGALRYHLRILVASHILQSHVPDSRRNVTYMLNSGSLMFPAPPPASQRPRADDPGADSMAATLSVGTSHPVRREVLGFLGSCGPADADSLRGHLASLGRAPARSTVSYHLNLLEEAGLVQVRQVHRRKVYRLAVEPQAVQAEQYARFLRQERALPLVALLAQKGRVTADEACASLRGAGMAGSPAARLVDRLLGLAVLESDGGMLRLAPPIVPIASDIITRGNP